MSHRLGEIKVSMELEFMRKALTLRNPKIACHVWKMTVTFYKHCISVVWGRGGARDEGEMGSGKKDTWSLPCDYT